TDDDVPPYPTDPMGPVDLPELDLPDLTDEEMEDVLRGMGS
ncbi:type II toxin-antitoxin system prevent-host-death family antitoxin, partial [Streptomyces sp. SID11233]|nr:type II toxin-antitoxin system prevent-host-death family antitoxin [Streptomyces sp. SID11233]